MTTIANDTNPEYLLYKEFCENTNSQCFYIKTPGSEANKLEEVNKVDTFSEYFLGYVKNQEPNPSLSYLYYIDNTEVFPSKKYKMKGPLESVGQIKRFQSQIKNGEWDHFYVSEPEIKNPLNGKNGVLAVTRNNYRQEIDNFRGDVVLLLVNSEHMGTGGTRE